MSTDDLLFRNVDRICAEFGRRIDGHQHKMQSKPLELELSDLRLDHLQPPACFANYLRCYLLPRKLQAMPVDCLLRLDLNCEGLGISKCRTGVVAFFKDSHARMRYFYFAYRHPEQHSATEITLDYPVGAEGVLHFFDYAESAAWKRKIPCYPELARDNVMGEFYCWLIAIFGRRIARSRRRRTALLARHAT
jgi:hypothetical protein